jgi:hypothetical protein
MIVNLPDEIFLRVKTQENMNKLLLKFCDYDINDPLIVINKTQRARIQEIFDCVIQNADDLIKRIEKLSQFKIGNNVFTFTPEQLVRFKQLAEFNNTPLKDYINNLVQLEINRFLSEV